MEKKRKNTIELVRFWASVLIIATHMNEFFGKDAAAFSNVVSVYADFFFMVSGFFLLQHLDKPENADETTFDMILGKVKGFWFPLCVANCVQLVIVCVMEHVQSIGGVLEKIWHFKWEFVLLQCAGFIRDPQFGRDYLIGPSWFLSAMLLALIVVYPLAKHFRRLFVSVICPLSVFFIYCGFMQAYGTLNVGNGFLLVVIMDAVLRAFAGLCTGAMCFQAYLYLKTKSWTSSKWYYILDGICWLMLPVSVLIAAYGTEDSGLFMIIPFCMIIISSVSENTPVVRSLSRFPDKASRFLGKMSLYIYLAQWSAIFAVMLFMPQAEGSIKIIFSSLITVIYGSILCFLDVKARKN